MYTTSPVQPFDEKNDENHDDGGNKKVYKWKMLVEKHKDDLRKLWDNDNDNYRMYGNFLVSNWL